MNVKPIKSTKPKASTKPETEISIQQEIFDLKIKANKIQNKILQKERQLLTISKKSGLFDDCVFDDKPE